MSREEEEKQSKRAEAKRPCDSGRRAHAPGTHRRDMARGMPRQASSGKQLSQAEHEKGGTQGSTAEKVELPPTTRVE